MSLNDLINSLSGRNAGTDLQDAISAATAPRRRTRFRREQAFLPGISESTYLAATGRDPENPKAAALGRSLPALRRAHATGNIFTFNQAMDKYKKRLAKATGHKRPPTAPDPRMQQKTAQQKQHRARDTGRSATMLSLGPRY